MMGLQLQCRNSLLVSYIVAASIFVANGASSSLPTATTTFPLAATTTTGRFSSSASQLRRIKHQDQRKAQTDDNGSFPDYSCNVESDVCSTVFDGVCDRNQASSSSSSSNELCQGDNSDCFDCDECTQFRADCASCLQHNCVWCPGDATCFNSDQYILLNLETSCTQPDDFTTTTCNNNVADVDAAFEDPLYSAQSWVYEMIHLTNVWQQQYMGQGVRVRINDNGVDVNHPEFDGRMDLDASCSYYLPFSNNNTTATTTATGNSQQQQNQTPGHGTSVAGIVGAAAGNDICSVGIAPLVTLSSCNIFVNGDDANNNNVDPYETWDVSQIDSYDISQNSYGENPCPPRNLENRYLQQQTCPFTQIETSRQSPAIPFPCDYCFQSSTTISTTTTTSTTTNSGTHAALSSECEQSIVLHCKYYWDEDKAGCLDFLDLLIQDGACHYSTALPIGIRDGLIAATQQGRNGKGIIVVAASGNTYTSGGDTNSGEGFANSRFAISVGAVGKDGKHASYSVPGASLFLTAPGGDHNSVSNHVTAALRTSSSGSGLCQDAGVGTSFACPVVSGVVALVLEANPDLTWRDVQEILALTSQIVNDDDNTDETAITNAAGYWHSNLYGFGIVDAAAAVEAALTWSLIGSEEMITESSGLINLPLVDDSSVVASTSITVSATNDSNNFRIQSVQVLLSLEYFSRGHLQVVLTSPQGTRSILHPGQRPENTQLDMDSDIRWKLLTVKAWGESPFGNWTLEIVDLQPGEVSTVCVDAAWSIDRSEVGDGTLDPVTCELIQMIGACLDGEVNPLNMVAAADMNILMNEYRDDDGIGAMDACCACGGKGVRREDVTDQLRQWTLVIYGHKGDATTTTNVGDDTTVVETLTPSPTTASSAETDFTFSPVPAPVDASTGSTPTLSPVQVGDNGFPGFAPEEADESGGGPQDSISDISSTGHSIHRHHLSMKGILEMIAATSFWMPLVLI